MSWEAWRVTGIGVTVTRDHGEGQVQGCSGPHPSCPVFNCSITWAVFIAGDYILLMLVEIQDPTTRSYFQVVSYDLGNWDAGGWGLLSGKRQEPRL